MGPDEKVEAQTKQRVVLSAQEAASMGPDELAEAGYVHVKSDRASLETYKQIMENRDQWGGLHLPGEGYTPEQRAAAATAYFAAKERIERVGLDSKEQQDRIALDQDRHHHTVTIQHREADFKEDELQVRKAEVVVKAMALLPEAQRVEMVKQLAQVLLEPSHQLEDREREPLRLIEEEKP